MSDFLFDTPLWALAGFAIVGIAVFVMGNNRTDAATRNIGIAILGLGALLFALSWFIDTGKEKSVKNSRQLVRAVQDRDWPTVEKLISPRFSAKIIGTSNVTYRSKAEMIEAIKMAVDTFDLKSAKVLSIEGTNNVDFIRVNLDVYSEQGRTMGYPITSSWQFDWQDLQEGWQLSEITALKIAGRSGDQIRGDFPKVAK